MVETGEIIDLSHGKYVLAPYKTVDIGLKDRVLVQGGVSPSKWLMNTNCFLSGVSRILPKDCIKEEKFPQNYSLQNWLMMPYTGEKLVEWTETIVGNLKYKKVLLDDQIQIYNPFISNNLHINRWINIGDVNSSFEYTIGRSRGIEGYSYWVLKDVKNGAYRSIASVDKYFLIRLLYGIDTISSASTSIFFSADEEFVFLYLPNRIPGEEMKIIKAISYPWPQICKNTYKWVISRELWEIIYPILVNLKVNIRQVQNIY